MRDIISKRLRLIDKTGRRWKRADSYQDDSKFAEGWLAMESEDGLVRPLPAIVASAGFDGPEGKHLVVEDGTYP